MGTLKKQLDTTTCPLTGILSDSAISKSDKVWPQPKILRLFINLQQIFGSMYSEKGNVLTLSVFGKMTLV